MPDFGAALPSVKIHTLKAPRTAHEPWGWSAYRIYAEADEICRLSGDDSFVMLNGAGRMRPAEWLPENAAALVRVLYPRQTLVMPDAEILCRADLRAYLAGPAVSNAVRSRVARQDGRETLDWDLKDPEQKETYRSVVQGPGVDFLRLDVVLDGVHSAITYSPPTEMNYRTQATRLATTLPARSRDHGCMPRRLTVPNRRRVLEVRRLIAGEIGIEHDPKFPWDGATMEFLAKRNPSRVVAGVDRGVLAHRVTDVSHQIAALGHSLAG